MPKITAIIPTFNEEANVAQAIESVLFADEIIVVDSYSTDRTVDIVKKYDVKLLQHAYENSAAQKNWTIPQASHEWIVLLDADEVLPPALQEEIRQTIAAQPKEVAFWMCRSNDFMGRRLRYSGWQGDKVIRLFQRDKSRYETKEVHAELLAEGEVGYLKNRIHHNTYKDFDHYLNKVNRYAWWQAKDYDPKTGRLTAFHFLVKPFARFIRHYIIKKGFLDGFPGFVISCLSSYAIFSRYVKMWLIRKGLR